MRVCARKIPQRFWLWRRAFPSGRMIIRARTRTSYPSQVSFIQTYRVISPLTHTVTDVTLQQVRLIIAEEEKARADAGSSMTHDITAGAFLLLGMDIQNLQYVLAQYEMHTHKLTVYTPFIGRLSLSTSRASATRPSCRQQPLSSAGPSSSNVSIAFARSNECICPASIPITTCLTSPQLALQTPGTPKPSCYACHRS